jgi:hypothetical protein
VGTVSVAAEWLDANVLHIGPSLLQPVLEPMDHRRRIVEPGRLGADTDVKSPSNRGEP